MFIPTTYLLETLEYPSIWIPNGATDLNNKESNKTTILITASDVRGEDRKRLIRELGRKPSEEKVSLYVRKPSEEQKDVENTTTKKFMDSMARRWAITIYLNNYFDIKVNLPACTSSTPCN